MSKKHRNQNEDVVVETEQMELVEANESFEDDVPVDEIVKEEKGFMKKLLKNKKAMMGIGAGVAVLGGLGYLLLHKGKSNDSYTYDPEDFEDDDSEYEYSNELEETSSEPETAANTSEENAEA